MAALDAAASEPVAVLIERAGAAVARSAVEMMGGSYGRRVVVLAGPGNNGADGRAAARRLRRRGARVEIIDVATAATVLPVADLYIDAAFGTGIKRGFKTPDRAATAAPVLAVDIPSGVDGLTGAVLDGGRPWAADRTVTFAALKPGLMFEPGRHLAGEVEVIDIGLPIGTPTIQVVQDQDVDRWWPRRDPTAHKWNTAVRVIGGGPGMTGAPFLATGGAMRSGAGYVQLLMPGVDPNSPGPVEAVRVAVPENGWAQIALDDQDRIAAVLIGPGLGGSPAAGAEVVKVVTECTRPLVVDADALTPAVAEALADRAAPTIVTPHDGEFARLGGDPSDPDRVIATVSLAEALGSHVVRKGPTTVVAAPDGQVRLVTIADQRLATAGAGDVLSGIILGALASGAEPFDAAAGGAHLHAIAARMGPPEGLTAGDLVTLIPSARAAVRQS